MSERCPKYQIVYDRAAGRDATILQIIDPSKPEGDALRVLHSSRSWATTASHLSFAMIELADLRRKLEEAKAENKRLRGIVEKVVAFGEADLALDSTENLDEAEDDGLIDMHVETYNALKAAAREAAKGARP